MYIDHRLHFPLKYLDVPHPLSIANFCDNAIEIGIISTFIKRLPKFESSRSYLSLNSKSQAGQKSLEKFSPEIHPTNQEFSFCLQEFLNFLCK